ncbi:hypothetical protein [Cereibacter azotoformans]|uniref:hypothetical protein n=1 Tax=Cereibacter azotoformans TaxID=43057 RepID=UPI001F208568|nr:hypothetical protein [Cereibacter azotoformans]
MAARTPAGFVNYVSKRPGGDIGELTFGLNDATSAWLELDWGRDLDAGLSFRLTGRVEGGDRYDDLNEGFRGTLAPSYRFTTANGTEVTLLANVTGCQTAYVCSYGAGREVVLEVTKRL